MDPFVVKLILKESDKKEKLKNGISGIDEDDDED